MESEPDESIFIAIDAIETLLFSYLLGRNDFLKQIII